jgi:AcrR family transcriptional regulator
MGRKAHYANEQFLDAALKLAAAGGPGAVTVAAIAEKLGAPIGSVYHRFPSRDVILAELWLQAAESFQAGFLEWLKGDDGLNAALYTPRWVRSHPEQGRLLLLYRQEELTWGPWPKDLKRRVSRLAKDLEEGMSGFTKRTYGRVTRKSLDRVVFALAELPLAAVRRYLQAGETPPDSVDELVREASLAVLRRTR